ncbi:MAG TPA: hypothetical protein PKK61_05980 [Defluviitaleaceae bacterium]|nr:hypothetical protein [Defluviitaleaceae bacterium]
MDITKVVAKMRFKYHTNMLDVCNVANQIGLLKDKKAEEKMKNHTMQSLDCLERLGYDVKGYINQKIES